MEPPLRYSKLRPRACSPKRATEHSIGYDIKSPINITVQSGTTALIPLGLAIEIPIGNYGRIAAKSGHAFKYSLLILGGTIDPDYRGEICAVVHVLGDKDWKIQAEEEVVHSFGEGSTPKTQEVPYSALTKTQRGMQGFGSVKVFPEKETKDFKCIVRSFYGNEDIVKKKETLYING